MLRVTSAKKNCSANINLNKWYSQNTYLVFNSISNDFFKSEQDEIFDLRSTKLALIRIERGFVWCHRIDTWWQQYECAQWSVKPCLWCHTQKSQTDAVATHAWIADGSDDSDQVKGKSNKLLNYTDARNSIMITTYTRCRYVLQKLYHFNELYHNWI